MAWPWSKVQQKSNPTASHLPALEDIIVNSPLKDTSNGGIPLFAEGIRTERKESAPETVVLIKARHDAHHAISSSCGDAVACFRSNRKAGPPPIPF